MRPKQRAEDEALGEIGVSHGGSLPEHVFACTVKPLPRGEGLGDVCAVPNPLALPLRRSPFRVKTLAPPSASREPPDLASPVSRRAEGTRGRA
jgi:hypothetical protein